MTGKIFTALTKMEAESQWARGRLRKAMAIYERLLAASPHMTLNTRLTIETRARLLRGELAQGQPETADDDC